VTAVCEGPVKEWRKGAGSFALWRAEKPQSRFHPFARPSRPQTGAPPAPVERHAVWVEGRRRPCSESLPAPPIGGNRAPIQPTGGPLPVTIMNRFSARTLPLIRTAADQPTGVDRPGFSPGVQPARLGIWQLVGQSATADAWSRRRRAQLEIPSRFFCVVEFLHRPHPVHPTIQPSLRLVVRRAPPQLSYRPSGISPPRAPPVFPYFVKNQALPHADSPGFLPQLPERR